MTQAARSGAKRVRVEEEGDRRQRGEQHGRDGEAHEDEHARIWRKLNPAPKTSPAVSSASASTAGQKMSSGIFTAVKSACCGTRQSPTAPP